MKTQRTLPFLLAALMAAGIPSPAGKTKWSTSTVLSILTNEKYKGDPLFDRVVYFLNTYVYFSCILLRIRFSVSSFYPLRVQFWFITSCPVFVYRLWLTPGFEFRENSRARGRRSLSYGRQGSEAPLGAQTSPEQSGKAGGHNNLYR